MTCKDVGEIQKHKK